MLIIQPSATLLSMTQHPLELIERAGRTCYKSESIGDPVGFVARLIKRGHESVLEHAVATFRIVCDRGVSHELVRHRIASFSQESTRYCNYAGGVTFIRPLHEPPQWREAMIAAEMAYLAALAEGFTPQEARHLLPLSLKTEVVMTANFREWRLIMRQRLAPEAHPHMRYVMGQVWDTFNASAPIIVKDIPK